MSDAFFASLPRFDTQQNPVARNGEDLEYGKEWTK